MTPKSFNRYKAGKLAHQRGDFAELRVQIVCDKEGILPMKIPSGMRVTRIKDQIVPVPVKTPFDFVFFKKGHRCICVDIKFTADTNFTFSKLTDHQIDALSRIGDYDHKTGYIVFFEKHDKVVFFSIDKLMALKPRDGLGPGDGMVLGNILKFTIAALFDSRTEAA